MCRYMCVFVFVLFACTVDVCVCVNEYVCVRMRDVGEKNDHVTLVLSESL